MGYEFEWDEAKARTNQRDHGVSFDEALSVFEDPLAVLLQDPDHSHSEQRYVVLGMSDSQRLLVVIHVERPPRTRIISARRATRRERMQYEEV